MNKNRYYKAPKPLQKTQKQLRKQKPEWTTDFVDLTKYKLSQAEMIQRKAALQSKNRETGRQALQQRRKKLQMGIIDEDTRKVYETALHAKKIDTNPVIRKNLSQMIQIQKQKRNQEIAKYNNAQDIQTDEEQIDDQDIQGQINEAKQFIKRLQKAKKQTNIQRAIDIMLDDNKNYIGVNSKISKTVKTAKSQIPQIDNEASQQEALSSIQQTIKFMQDKLFNRSKIAKKDQTSRPYKNTIINKNNFIDQNNTISLNEQSYQIQRDNEQNNSRNEFLQIAQQHLPQYKAIKNKHSDNDQIQGFKNFQKNKNKQQESLSIEEQLSSLRLQFEDKTPSHQEEDEDCMSTIRRMRQMIGSKQHLYEPEVRSKLQKQNIDKQNSVQAYLTMKQHTKLSQILDKDEDEEVDFSLTLNQQKTDELQYEIKHEKLAKKQHRQTNINKYSEYQKLKRNIFEDVDKLNNYCFNQQRQNCEIQQVGYLKQYRTSSQHTDQWMGGEMDASIVDSKQQKRKKQKKKKKREDVNDMADELQQLRTMVEGNKKTVTKIQVQPMGVTRSSGMMGFDFRGSINIKKNIAK